VPLGIDLRQFDFVVNLAERSAARVGVAAVSGSSEPILVLGPDPFDDFCREAALSDNRSSVSSATSIARCRARFSPARGASCSWRPISMRPGAQGPRLEPNESAEPDPPPEPDDVWVAVNRLFNAAFGRLDKLDARLSAIDQRLDGLEAQAARPAAARVVRHVRNADGDLVKSVLISGADE
jgi:hypothetical protein